MLKGNLTKIVKRFNSREIQKAAIEAGDHEYQSPEILELLSEKDDNKRTPIDIACYLGFQNTAVYLMSKMGTPADIISQELNIDMD